MPQSLRLCPGYGTRLESAFGLTQVNQIQRYTFFFEDLFDHRLIPAYAFQTPLDGSLAAAILIVVEQPKDTIVDLDGQIMANFFDFIFNFILQPGVDRGGECLEVFQIIDGRMLLGLTG